MPNVAVSKEVLDDLRRAICDKYGGLRPHLMREASEALEARAKKLREG